MDDNAVPAAQGPGQGIKDAVRRYLTEWRAFLAPIGIMSAIYVLGLSALLRANFNYIDDFQRVNGGMRGWHMSSRYLSQYLSPLIHGDTFLADISPLPQLLACVMLGAASVIVLHLITGRRRFTFWQYAAVVPLGLCPYMLECLAFKYDSPYMALSVLVSVAPLLLWSAKSWALCLACALGALGVCNTYQAATGILPMLTVMMAFLQWQQRRPWRDILRFIGAAAAGYCLGMLIYKFFIMSPPQVDYAATTLPPLAELVPMTVGHYRDYYARVLAEFDPKWLLLCILLGAGFLWAAVCSTERSRLLSLLLALAVLAALLLLAFGVYPLFIQPMIRPRTMYGLGAALALPAVYAVSGRRAFPFKLAGLALSWCFLVFSLIYGNTLFVQKSYTDFRIQEIIDGMKDTDSGLFSGDQSVIFQIKGSIGYAPPIQRTVEEFPMLTRLIPNTLNGYTWINYYAIANYYGLPDLSWTSDDSIDMYKFHLPLIDDTVYHTIYGNEHFILIELK